MSSVISFYTFFMLNWMTQLESQYDHLLHIYDNFYVKKLENYTIWERATLLNLFYVQNMFYVLHWMILNLLNVFKIAIFKTRIICVFLEVIEVKIGYSWHHNFFLKQCIEAGYFLINFAYCKIYYSMHKTTKYIKYIKRYAIRPSFQELSLSKLPLPFSHSKKKDDKKKSSDFHF